MIREMRRIDGQNRALESVMEAFAFTGSNVLRIETDVETCLDSCNPVSIYQFVSHFLELLIGNYNIQIEVSMI